jgi:hypothetical protein
MNKKLLDDSKNNFHITFFDYYYNEKREPITIKYPLRENMIYTYENVRKEILLDSNLYDNYNYYFIVPFIYKINEDSNIKRLYFYILDSKKEWTITIYNTDLKHHVFIIQKEFLDYLDFNKFEEGYFKISSVYEEEIGNFIKNIHTSCKIDKLQVKYPVYLNLINK